MLGKDSTGAASGPRRRENRSAAVVRHLLPKDFLPAFNLENIDGDAPGGSEDADRLTLQIHTEGSTAGSNPSRPAALPAGGPRPLDPLRVARHQEDTGHSRTAAPEGSPRVSLGWACGGDEKCDFYWGGCLHTGDPRPRSPQGPHDGIHRPRPGGSRVPGSRLGCGAVHWPEPITDAVCASVRSVFPLCSGSLSAVLLWLRWPRVTRAARFTAKAMTSGGKCTGQPPPGRCDSGRSASSRCTREPLLPQ